MWKLLNKYKMEELFCITGISCNGKNVTLMRPVVDKKKKNPTELSKTSRDNADALLFKENNRWYILWYLDDTKECVAICQGTEPEDDYNYLKLRE